MNNPAMLLSLLAQRTHLPTASSAILYQCIRNFNSTSKSTSPANASANKQEVQSSTYNEIVLHSSKNELAETVAGEKHKRRKKEILRMDPAEYANCAIGVQKLPLIERRGEDQTVWKHILPDRNYNHVDMMAFIQADIDLRPATLKRLWASVEAEWEIKQQAYNPERNKILGNDLAAAHFIVFRRGKVKFLHMSEWITQYRKDIKPKEDDDEEDLPPVTFQNCTLPTKYHPNYRVEAIDCEGVTVFYNGLANFEGLTHVSWLRFRKADKRFDDWCLDRIYRIFPESLEYLDLSGCTGISERGLAGAWRLKYLKTLVVENLPHIKNLEMVCALLEEKLPNLTCVGVDYERRLHELKLENEHFERTVLAQEEEVEANTITITPRIEFKEYRAENSTELPNKSNG